VLFIIIIIISSINIINKFKRECICRKLENKQEIPTNLILHKTEFNGQENNMNVTRKTAVRDCVEWL
jgi:hypothetical protein